MILWKHHKQRDHLYQIHFFGIVEATMEVVVIYQRTDGGGVFTRPAAEFFDGRFKQVDTFGDEEQDDQPELSLEMPELSLMVKDAISPILENLLHGRIRTERRDADGDIVGVHEFPINTGKDSPGPYISLEEFNAIAGEFLTGGKEDALLRRAVVKTICETFEVEKWSQIPEKGRRDAMTALEVYRAEYPDVAARKKHEQDNLNADEIATLAAIRNRTPYMPPGQKVEFVPPLKDRAVDMRGVSIVPGDNVELASLGREDRVSWGSAHFRKVKMVDPDGRVTLEGEGDNIWLPGALLVATPPNDLNDL